VRARELEGTGPSREEELMTRSQLNHSIAARTGEPLSVIRRLGFRLLVEPDEEPVAEEVRLVVPCPFCGDQVPYPGRTRDGSHALAECQGCDIYFDVQDHDVFPAISRAAVSPTPARRRYLPA
jgi:hypothetical protein